MSRHMSTALSTRHSMILLLIWNVQQTPLCMLSNSVCS